MLFTIQASCPKYTQIFNEEVKSIADAIENIFPLATERIVISWRYIPILLSYKYDMSVMIDDILEVLKQLREYKSGSKTIYWASNTFAHVWHFSWDSTHVSIKSEWGNVAGGLEELLQRSGDILLTKQVFSSEWKKVFQNIITALNKSGYSPSNLPDMEHLIYEYREIETEGNLYQ